MRKLVLCLLFLSVFSSACVSAQSLVGTWESTEQTLVSLKFSLTFYEKDYLIDTSFGQTIGTYYCTADKIYFSPTKAGINGGDIGRNDVWGYRFLDEDSFSMNSGVITIRLVRVGSKEWEQAQQEAGVASHHGR